MDALRYWVTEMHDGFRFDLAATLAAFLQPFARTLYCSR